MRLIYDSYHTFSKPACQVLRHNDTLHKLWKACTIDSIEMSETTKQIATRLIEPPVWSEAEGEATGAWSPIDDTSVDTESLPAISAEHPLKQTLVRRLGRAVYWLTHGDYRQEVRQRADDIVLDLASPRVRAKQVLPPRSRDFRDVPERRRQTANLALDIRRYIQTMRMMRRIMGALTLMTVDHAELISPTPLPTMPERDTELPPTVAVIEEELAPLDGETPNDGDFIAKLVIDS